MAPAATVGIPFAAGDPRAFRLAVRSIFAQTESDWELLLWSDGAPDELVELALAIRDPRVQVRLNRPGVGLAATLNRIASAAAADVLVRMDADDVMLPERLAVTLKHLREHEDVDLLATRALLLDEHDHVHGLLKEDPGVGDLTRAVVRNPITHPTVAARTTWFREHPYSEAWRRTEDKHLWQTAGPGSVIEKLPTATLAYRIPQRIDRSKISRTRREDRRLLRAFGPEAVGAAATRAALRSSHLGGVLLAVAAGTPLEAMVHRRKAEPLSDEAHRSAAAALELVVRRPVPGWSPEP